MAAKREPQFATEAELCEAFTAWARREGFTVYPETAGWDLLLVADDGHQLGIEAKLSLNLKVIEQVLKHTLWSEQAGPDFRGVLVPNRAVGVEPILAHCGVEIFIPEEDYRGWRAGTRTWTFKRPNAWTHEMHDWNPARRCELPEYLPDVPAGVPAPRTLSPWKIGALRVLALMEVQGYVTRDDVRRCKNDPRRWCASDGWLSPLGDGRWGRGSAPRFDEQHPDIYAQILSEMRDHLKQAAA